MSTMQIDIREVDDRSDTGIDTCGFSLQQRCRSQFIQAKVRGGKRLPTRPPDDHIVVSQSLNTREPK